MNTLIGIAFVAAWIAISVVALKRAFGSRSPSPNSAPGSSPDHDNSVCERA